MSIDKDKANVYKILSEIIQKCFLTFVLTVILCFVTYYLVTSEPEWAKTAPLATIEGVLTHTVYKMVSHFYPQKK